jgi:hypothetical protein
MEVMAKRAVPDFAWNQTCVLQLIQPGIRPLLSSSFSLLAAEIESLV